MSLWYYNKPHAHSLQKAMTIDKEQTSDENVISTNLNDSVGSCSNCMSRNEDGQITSVPIVNVIYTLLESMATRHSLFTDDPSRVHHPLMRNRGTWGLREINHRHHQKQQHWRSEQQLIPDGFESSSNRSEPGAYPSWGLETLLVYILWSSTMIRDVSLFWQ